MTRYNRYGVQFSGSDEFFSDENLQWEPASPADYGVGPNENPADAARVLGRSVPQVAWSLDDVEVDSGSRGGNVDTDHSHAFSTPPAPAPMPAYPVQPEIPAAGLDQLVDLLADKLMKRLGGQ